MNPSNYRAGYNGLPGNPGNNDPAVVTALFRNAQDAQDAVQELREVGISQNGISLISRDEDSTQSTEEGGLKGADREEVQDEGITYRVADELPNDEDLPTTEAAMTGQDMPISLDYETPPDDPLGGGVQLGLARDDDKVRRNEAETNADEDIYTDFPNAPGGIDPASPAASHVSPTSGDVQDASKSRTDPAGPALAGAGLGSLAGLLVGMAGLAIPGVGPFIAAGPLAGALSGLIAGGATGGLVGALSAVGVPDEFAREYAAQIQQGQVLVSVRTDKLSQDLVERVLVANHGEHVQCNVVAAEQK